MRLNLGRFHIDVTVTIDPIPFENLTPREEVTKRKIHRTVGIQRRMLELLYTGPATRAELIKSTLWQTRVVRDATNNMSLRGLVVAPEDREEGKWRLSEGGLEKARWFLRHPQLIVARKGMAEDSIITNAQRMYAPEITRHVEAIRAEAKRGPIIPPLKQS